MYVAEILRLSYNQDVVVIAWNYAQVHAIYKYIMCPKTGIAENEEQIRRPFKRDCCKQNSSLLMETTPEKIDQHRAILGGQK